MNAQEKADHTPAAILWLIGAAVLGMALSLSCGKSPVEPSASPSPRFGGTHGSSAADPNALACTVTGAAIDVEVDGHHTGGYFSASDKGVTAFLSYLFVDGTNADGKCPGPTTALWSIGANGAVCGTTGQPTRPFIFIDCANPGRSVLRTSVIYPDGFSEVVELDLNVS